jgi:hypothetical protein
MSSAEISGTVRKSLWPRRSTIPGIYRVNLQAPKADAEHFTLRCNLLGLVGCRVLQGTQSCTARMHAKWLWERRAPPIDSTISNASKLIIESICMSLRVLKPFRTPADVAASIAVRHALDKPDFLRGGPSLESMEQVASFAFQLRLTTFRQRTGRSARAKGFCARRLQASPAAQLASSSCT